MKAILLRIAVLAVLASSSGTQAQSADYPGIWTTFTRANSGLIGDSILAVTFDNKDSLWIAAYQGVAQQVPAGWTRYNSTKFMPSNDIWDMDHANGSVWIGHRTGITRYDHTDWLTYTVDNSDLVNAPVHNFAHDSRGDLWYGTARGLGRLTAANAWYSYTRATIPAMPYDGIEALAIDQSNTVWMSFIGTAGMVKFPDGNSQAAKYLKQDSIPGFPKGAVYVKALAVDWSGNLWAGTARHGVVRINAAGATIFSRQTTTVIQNDTVNAVTVDRCGNVWIGTEKGAFMYDGSTWYPFTTATEKLENDFVYTIEVDRFGHVWIGTKGGLTEFKPLPKRPVLLDPPMAAVIDTNSVVCRWDPACPGVIKYWYEIADNPDFNNSRIDTTSASLMTSMSAMDTGLSVNTTYYWRVKALNDAGWSAFSNTWTFTVQASGVAWTELNGYRLLASYPNPTSTHSTISFLLPRAGQVSLTLYDAVGRPLTTVTQGVFGPGSYSFPVETGNLPTGVYIYRLTARGVTLERSMHVVR